MNKYIGDENCFSRLVDDGDGYMITVWYEAHNSEIQGSCSGCALNNWGKCSMLRQQGILPFCVSQLRTDKRDVIWKEVEK